MINYEINVTNGNKKEVIKLIEVIQKELLNGNKIEAYFDTNEGVEIIFTKNRDV